MAHLIDKDAVVAEIERLRKIQPTDEFQPKEQNKIDWLAGKEFAIIILQMFLDTLEVKETDLDREIRHYRMRNPIIQHKEESLYDYMANVAKHFFELGMQASNKAQRGE